MAADSRPHAAPPAPRGHRARSRVAGVLAGAAALLFAGWLVAALLGAQPSLVEHPLLSVQLGRWTNVRLVAWLLLLAALAHPARDALLSRADAFLSGRGQWLFPSGLAAFAVAFKVTQHLAFGTGAFDLSMYHSAVRYAWAPGPSFMWAFGIEHSFLGDHFSPVLLAFVPFDAVFRSPLVLLIGEAAVFGLGALTIAGTGRLLGLRPVLAQLVAAVYATNVVCWDALAFDFHPETMLPACLFAALWALKARRAGWSALSLLVTLSIKEDVAIVLIPMVALVWLDDRRRWRWPLAVTVLAAAWMLLAVGVAMPLARPPGIGWSMFQERYGDWGATPGEALRALLSRPADVLRLVTGEAVTSRLRQLAWTPALDPIGLLASIPALLEQLVSRSELQRGLQAYYGIGAAAVWLLALSRAVRALSRRSLVAGLLLAAAPLLYRPTAPSLARVNAQDLEDARVLAATIPPGETVAAQTTLVPHLPISPAVRLFPTPGTTWVALRPAGNPWPLTGEAYRATVLHLLDVEGFGVVVRTPGLVLLRQGAPTAEVQAVKDALPR